MYENYSVLFVDDEINILNSLRRGLMDEGYVCHFASSGKMALEIMEKENISVIVSDMRMPEMTGLTLLKNLSDKWPKTVKIVLSGYTQLQQILTTINQVDIFKFITKPWNLEEFSEIIKKALDYYILREENENYKNILESKNLAYINILNRIDDVIADAKKSSELLGLFGKAIIGFGKNFDPKERVKYSSIFNMKEAVFEILSNAVTNEKKEYNGAEIIEWIAELISNNISNSKIEKTNNLHQKIKINIKLLEAVLLSLRIVFRDEFNNNGILGKIVINDENRLVISIISPKANSNYEINQKSGLTLLDVKIEFVKSVLENALGKCKITLLAIKKADSLVIGIIFKE